MQTKWSACSLLLVLVFLSTTVQAQESVYFQKLVYESDGSLIERTPPEVSFTVYLNGDERRILTETAPRLGSDDPNITGNGSFGVELANFPELTEGDTVTVRFTDTAVGEQGAISAEIDEIPWTDPEPFTTLTLSPAALPLRPENVDLDDQATVSWDAVDSLSYSVYRRALEDSRDDGVPRSVYTRVADRIDGGSFTDADATDDSTFAYIVFAYTTAGVASPHSKEVVERLHVSNLSVSAGPTNAELAWDAFEAPVGRTVGYVIYRSDDGGSTRELIAYTGEETEYTDTRLEPGTTYHYTIRARNERQEELGESDEIAVTTEASTAGYVTYANLKVAVVLYANAIERGSGNQYQMTAGEIADIQQHLETAREFYWRNSRMNLNLEFDYFIIDEYKDFGGLETAENRAQSVTVTGTHLAEDFGVMSTQYDLVYRITPSTGGNYSWGVTHRLELPGPDREVDGKQVGFSQHPVPQGGGFDQYPDEFDTDEEGYNHIWLFIHEAQHAIDGIYRFNDHPEMGHGDFPELYGNPDLRIGDDPGYAAGSYPPDYPSGFGYRFGKRFDFQATMLREFDAYQDLETQWGDIYETPDVDGDGFPDDDPRVPLDEARFGSSPTDADADGDGLTDHGEAIAGIYQYSVADPNDPDTDGDGLLDGDDEYPLYPVARSIKRVEGRWKPIIDGDVSDWPEEALISDAVLVVTDGESLSPEFYMAYDDDSLYVGFSLEKLGVPLMKFDFEADGRWYGAGNTTIEFNVSEGNYRTFESWDATSEVQEYLETEQDRRSGDGMWDSSGDYLNQFNRRVMHPSTTNLQITLDLPRVDIEMALPRNEFAGLTLQEGDTLGVLVDYSNVDQTTRAKATTFDQWSYVYLPLSAEFATAADDRPEKPVQYRLEQNYPNPFNPRTTIRFALPEPADVDLSVYNVLGREVSTLASGPRSSGRYEVSWDGLDAGGRAVASGVYFYRLETSTGRSLSRRMVLLR